MSTNKKAKIILGAVILIILIIGGIIMFINKNKKDRYEAFLDSGQLYADDQQYDKSVIDFRKAVKLYPDRYDAHAPLAVALVFAGINNPNTSTSEAYYREAIALIDEYLEKIPTDNPDAWVHRGMAYYQLKDYEQAELNFAHAAAADPSDTIAKSLLENVRTKLKSIE